MVLTHKLLILQNIMRLVVSIELANATGQGDILEPLIGSDFGHNLSILPSRTAVPNHRFLKRHIL